MNKTNINRMSFKEIFQVNWKSFKVLISMLLANSLSLDFKKNKKKSIINITLKVLIFAIAIVISYIFFYFCIKLSVFSLLPFVPTSVPSIIINIMLIVSFITTLMKTTNELYFANDNKVLLTLPTNGGTLFLARLFVVFINSYIKALTLEIPFILGYFLVSKFPIYMLFIIFFIFIIVELVFVLLSAIISIPIYFIKKLFISYPLVKRIIYLVFIVAIIILVSLLISIIPEKIDIFSNWSPYFNMIQDGLKWYTNNLSFFYQTSLMYLGGFNGYVFKYFTGIGIGGLYTFIVFICLIPVLYFISLSLATPFYLKLASGNDELLAKSKIKKDKSHIKNPIISQLNKELLLFIKDNKIAPAYTSVFIALPLLLSLICKIFMAMDLNSRGLSLVQVAMLLITLLIVLSTNALIAKMYSNEGGAFKIARTYPINNGLLLTSKITLPTLIGTISIIISYIIIANLRSELLIENLLLGLGILFIYIGHLLYSASLDFTNPKAEFGDINFLSNNENRSIIMSFILSALVSYLFYLFTEDSIIWISSIQMTSSFKLLLIGILYLIYNIFNYIRKIKYVYTKGETL